MADSIEDQALARLEEGAKAAEATHAARLARYASEDFERAAARAEEDRLAAQGDADRAAMKASLEAAIEARVNTPQKKMGDQIADLTAKLAHLENLVAAHEAPAAVAPAAQTA